MHYYINPFYKIVQYYKTYKYTGLTLCKISNNKHLPFYKNKLYNNFIK